MQSENSPADPGLTIVDLASAAPLADLSQIDNVTDLLLDRLRTAPDHIAFEIPARRGDLHDPWEQISTREFMRQVTDAARGLIARGVETGDAILIMAPTHYLWAVADFASLFAGAIVVPAYETATDTQIDAILDEMKPVAAFAGDGATERRISASAARTGQSLHTWVLGDEDGNDPRSTPIRDLMTYGTDVTDEELEARRSAASLDDIATVVYTSGTTAAPKGALITHRNLVGQVLNTAAAYGEVVRETGNTVLFLPLTHVLGRALQLICVAKGMRVAHLSDPKEVVQALAVLQPTFLVVVPRVLEKIEAAAAGAAREKRIEPVWRIAAETARNWGAHLEEKDLDAARRAPLRLRLQHAVFDRIFYRRLRRVMGGRIEYLLSGAATLPPSLALFFRGIGVPTIEGYGLTETTAPLTGGRPGALVAGSVGTPLPGNTVGIASNGEVLAKGIGVFNGYRNPAHNADAFLDGYFRTGDLGSLSADGSLTLNGRLKHIIVTSTGRTVAPGRWEHPIEAHPLVAHAILIGTDRRYLTGIVLLDAEAIAARPPHAEPERSETGVAGVQRCTDPQVLREIGSAVEEANALVTPTDRAQHWCALILETDRMEEFLTPTMKLKRGLLIEDLAPVVDDLYR